MYSNLIFFFLVKKFGKKKKKVRCPYNILQVTRKNNIVMKIWLKRLKNSWKGIKSVSGLEHCRFGPQYLIYAQDQSFWTVRQTTLSTFPWRRGIFDQITNTKRDLRFYLFNSFPICTPRMSTISNLWGARL